MSNNSRASTPEVDRVFSEVSMWLTHLAQSSTRQLHGATVVVMQLAASAALVEKVAAQAITPGGSTVDAAVFRSVRDEAARVRTDAMLLVEAAASGQDTLESAHAAMTPGVDQDADASRIQRDLSALAHVMTQTRPLASTVLRHIETLVEDCPQDLVWNLGVAACALANSLEAAQVALQAFRRPISDPVEREKLNQAADDMSTLTLGARRLWSVTVSRSRV